MVGVPCPLNCLVYENIRVYIASVRNFCIFNATLQLDKLNFCDDHVYNEPQ
jgi:hypothetical protein